MGSIGTATPISRVGIAETTPAPSALATGASAHAGIVRALGALGLLGIVTSIFIVSAGASSAPGEYVPARTGGWPAWMAGPLRGLGIGLSNAGFQTLVVVMCVSYLLVLVAASRLPMAALFTPYPPVSRA